MAYIWRNLIIGKQILPKICNNLTKFKYENDILNSFSDIFSLKIVYCFQKCSHIHFDHILLLPPTPPMFSSSQPLLLTHQILCSFPLFSRFRALCRREGAKIIRPVLTDDFKTAVFSRPQRLSACMNSQKLGLLS